MDVALGVLGPVTAADADGRALDLRGPRHRAVLARLLVARGRVVPLADLVDDLWEDPPPRAAGAVQTFVGALRRGLEPDRVPRTPPRLIVTTGGGYAVRTGPGDVVDAWSFEAEVAGASRATPDRAVPALADALVRWRGTALADLPDAAWVLAERRRLEALRVVAVEDLAAARLATGAARQAIADLEHHVEVHPWRESGWRLLATALYRDERAADGLAVLRRARHLLADELGLDPGPELAALERDLLLRAPQPVSAPAAEVWGGVATAYQRVAAARPSTRLRSAMHLVGELAVTGGQGLEASRVHRIEAIEAAEALGDPEVVAAVVGGLDVPGVWARSDDPAQAAQVVVAARRALGRLPAGTDRLRARLLATVALESRGTADAAAEADEAVAIARALGDPQVLALALTGAAMQSFGRAGLAARRSDLGAEVATLSARHGLTDTRIAGEILAMQAAGALGRFADGEERARALDRLGEREDRPAVSAFTAWFRAVRLDVDGGTLDAVDRAYRRADALLAGMPGVQHGALALALLAARLTRGVPVTDGRVPGVPGEGDPRWGPYLPWVRPHLLLARGRTAAAESALRAAPTPPADHLLEATWSLLADAALALDDTDRARQALAALAPASGEVAGAGSGMLALWPVDATLARLRAATG
ncbi:AfsR/SARP family transcriptional regulator [Cellulomonas triticagri]|uniref:SARP family transcriptional regulator n=1 Tax=Cellulomonas triticagri TaxID=2483352 RepID=A0A3M2JPL3_9CELL|nr:BTAD domain-containing putative transcriptional regulator [Cellulomonas triticagri]RMI14291.1 SARP family transcriptional regulator [Cellulomonas triticagri]